MMDLDTIATKADFDAFRAEMKTDFDAFGGAFDAAGIGIKQALARFERRLTIRLATIIVVVARRAVRFAAFLSPLTSRQWPGCRRTTRAYISHHDHRHLPPSPQTPREAGTGRHDRGTPDRPAHAAG